MGKRRSEKRRKARTLFDDSIFKNLYTYEQYADLFTEIAVSSFKSVLNFSVSSKTNIEAFFNL